jgi:hypothetical protein
MQVYVGQTRSRDWIKRLGRLGFGEMLAPPAKSPPRRLPVAVDNGAYTAFTAGVPWDGAWLLDELDYFDAAGFQPDFVVCPDIVQGGAESLRFSLEWAPRLSPRWPLYLAVQDGMSEADVAPHVGGFAGLFVGGSIPWKVRTGAAWVRLAHSLGKRCHVGRVGTEDRVVWAREIGADSIDSCLPLFAEGNLQRFLRGLNPARKVRPRPTQGELFG